jgi:hypothetical protein
MQKAMKEKNRKRKRKQPTNATATVFIHHHHKPYVRYRNLIASQSVKKSLFLLDRGYLFSHSTPVTYAISPIEVMDTVPRLMVIEVEREEGRMDGKGGSLSDLVWGLDGSDLGFMFYDTFGGKESTRGSKVIG